MKGNLRVSPVRDFMHGSLLNADRNKYGAMKKSPKP